MSRRLFVTGWLLVAAATFAASTPIGEVVKNRDAYANKTVTIEGMVTERSYGYSTDAIYDLRGSDDYNVTIVGKGPAPAPGTKLVVTGKVGRKPPDEEFDFPPVIQETTRLVQ
jgi:hypothetical protein